MVEQCEMGHVSQFVIRRDRLPDWGWVESVCMYPQLLRVGCRFCMYAGWGCQELKTDGVCEGVEDGRPAEVKKWLYYLTVNRMKKMKRMERFGYGMYMSRRLGVKNRFVTLSYFKMLRGWMWTNFVKYMRYKMAGRFEYAKVMHTVGDRQHIHFVYRGDYINVREIGSIWKQISGHGTVWINECDGNDVVLHGYMNAENKGEEDVMVRWSFSRKWAPRVEQSLLTEFPLGSTEIGGVGE